MMKSSVIEIETGQDVIGEIESHNNRIDRVLNSTNSLTAIERHNLTEAKVTCSDCIRCTFEEYGCDGYYKCNAVQRLFKVHEDYEACRYFKAAQGYGNKTQLVSMLLDFFEAANE